MMEDKKRLIDANALIRKARWMEEPDGSGILRDLKAVSTTAIEFAPTVDAVEVVHGRWGMIAGDLHSNGYPVVCTICNKAHFVHYKNSLGGLNLKELFELPKYCPNCGAKMDGESK